MKPYKYIHFHTFTWFFREPLINEQFIRIIMNIVSIQYDDRGNRMTEQTLTTMDPLITFYNNVYSKLIDETKLVSREKLGQILAYEAIDIVKNINTNIKEHFVQYVYRYINHRFKLDYLINQINQKQISDNEKKERKTKVYRIFRAIKYDLLNVSDNTLTSPKKYHEWIRKNRFVLLPKKISYQKNSIHYDICCNPQDYLPEMIHINTALECLMAKTFNILPLRRSNIPHYITIDTAALIHLFVDKNSMDYLKNIGDHQHMLWNIYFNLDKRSFQKTGYQFNHMIKTDGIACSIVFIKLDKDDKPMKLSAPQLRKLAVLKEQQKTSYIEDQPRADKILKNKNYVVIDPNMSDLLYCMDKSGKKFRYTQNQRQIETRNRKYNKIIQEFKHETKLKNGQTIETLEATLSDYNAKTNDPKAFGAYIETKDIVNKYVREEYQYKIYRKLKRNRYINKQRSESKMVKNFREKFGNPDNTIVIVGDFDKGNNHMRGKEPAKIKGMRKVIKNAGYKTFLINEYNTSKICNKCHSETETFHKRCSHRPQDHGKMIVVWGLLRCKNENCKRVNIQGRTQFVKSIYNRDTNAVLNMLTIVKSLITKGTRPNIFRRKQKTS